MAHPPGPDSGELVMPQDVITGEAVVLDLRPASFATRVLAYLLDLMLQALVLVGGSWLLFRFVSDLDSAAAGAMVTTLAVAVLVFLPAGWETMTRGRSPGKIAAGLRVVRDDGGPIRWRQALVRALLAGVEIIATGGSMALICSLWNPRGKRVGDLLAGTYVVRERVPSAARPTPQAPPELAGWVVGADIGRLPDPLALSAHQFLSRAPRMHPASRAHMGAELAGQVARFVAPPPPGPVVPERFIAAVLAERHSRSLRRLTVEQERRARRRSRRTESPLLSPSSTRLLD